MISVKELQESNFSQIYINNSLNQLIGIKNNIFKINNSFKELENLLKDYFNKFKSYFSDLLNEVNNCISWLKETNFFCNDNKELNINLNNNYKKNIHEKFMKCYKFKDILYENDYVKKIILLNKDLEKIINDIYEMKFDPPKKNNYSDSILKINICDNNISTIESEGPFSNDNNNNTSKDYANAFEYLNDEFSNEPFNSNIQSIENKINIKKIELKEDDDDDVDDNEEKNNNKDNNLKCSDCKINNAIYKCYHCNKLYCQGCSNFYLEYGEGQNHKFNKIQDSQLNIEIVKEIYLKNLINLFKEYLVKSNELINLENPIINEFPQINDIKDFNSEKKFLQQINELYQKNEDRIKKSDDKKIDGVMINLLNNIFENKKLHLSRNIIDIDDGYESDEKFVKEVDSLKCYKNKLYYFITIVQKETIKIKNDLIKEIIKKISDSLSINNNHIFLLINKKVDNFVKSKNFSKLSYNQIKIENPILKKLSEMKLLTDKFLNIECNIPKINFDYKGNCLNPNSNENIIRGSEKYDPPYGWMGIGLNVLGKYDNGNNNWLKNNTKSSEWAIAYHGINPKLSSDKVKKILNYIIKERKGFPISKMKNESNDKRHWGKVGDGVYLSPNIKIAEYYTGIVSFNDKKYKVLLMAKVYIKGIREPEKTNFWVLDEKNIRIYRILFKEINN